MYRVPLMRLRQIEIHIKGNNKRGGGWWDDDTDDCRFLLKTYVYLNWRVR